MSQKIGESNRNPFIGLTNLVSNRLGAKVLYASDDFFAEKENLILATDPVFIPDKYTERGKWMDGWESRRKRDPGNDYCIIQMATTGVIQGFDVATTHFKGNAPLEISIEGAMLDQFKLDIKTIDKKISWVEVLPRVKVNPDSHNYFRVSSPDILSHLKLQIYPDGGVARLKAYGAVYKNWLTEDINDIFDLASVLNGGKAIACNDMFFSSMDNINLPDKGLNMGDGWETKRNRTPGNVDWVILKLAKPGFLNQIVVDTLHFKGNYPAQCSLEVCYNSKDQNVIDGNVFWQEILSPQDLGPDQEHIFMEEIKEHDKASHVRLKIYPDGGISRLRLFGTFQ